MSEASSFTSGPNSDFGRIQPIAFTASIFTFLAIAIAVSSFRTYLRIRAQVPFAVDDALLYAALLMLAGGTAVVYKAQDGLYLQTGVTTGTAGFPPPDFLDRMRQVVVLQHASSMLSWAAIFLVKFSFLAFFRKLVSRVRNLEILWYITVTIVAACTVASIPIGLIICHDFSENMFQSCPIQDMTNNEAIYLKVTTALDILSDCLVLSLPVSVLYGTRISTKQKLGIGSVLSLSIFMIAIALVRSTLAFTPSLLFPPAVPDTIWIFFWQFMEACVAIIMVSLTAFRSLYKQQQHSKPYKGSQESSDSRGYGRVPGPEASGYQSAVSSKSNRTDVRRPENAAFVYSTDKRETYDNIPLRSNPTWKAHRASPIPYSGP